MKDQSNFKRETISRALQIEISPKIRLAEFYRALNDSDEDFSII